MTLLEKNGTPIGSYAPDFELRGIDDQVYHLARYLEKFRAVGVVFMCNHCPDVWLYLDRLKKLQASFHHQGFTLMGINANDATQYPVDRRGQGDSGSPLGIGVRGETRGQGV